MQQVNHVSNNYKYNESECLRPYEKDRDSRLRLLASGGRSALAAERSMKKYFPHFTRAPAAVNIATSIIITLIACYYYYPITTFLLFYIISDAIAKSERRKLLRFQQHVPRLFNNRE
jgi:hypothetical protein